MTAAHAGRGPTGCVPPDAVPMGGRSLSRRAFVVGSGATLAACGGTAARDRASAEEAPRDDVVAFLVITDTHYLADRDAPGRLDAWSAGCTGRLVDSLNRLPGTDIPASAGGGTVRRPACVIHAGDIIDTGDKAGAIEAEMQRTEVAAFEKSLGLTGRDGDLDFPVYEVHGNHDGPAGTGPAIDRIVARTRLRPGVTHVSPDGLHYSWDVGPVHFVNLGIVVGAVPGVARRRRYAPRGSLDFLVADLRERVGTSGRPVVITHHVDVARHTAPVPADAPFSGQEWDPADVGGFHAALAGHTVAAIFHGHTHARAVWRWDGASVAAAGERLTDAELQTGDRRVYDVFNTDNASAPRGGRQAVCYVEIGPDGLTVREYATQDAWRTGGWSPLVWRRAVAT